MGEWGGESGEREDVMGREREGKNWERHNEGRTEERLSGKRRALCWTREPRDSNAIS